MVGYFEGKTEEKKVFKARSVIERSSTFIPDVTPQDQVSDLSVFFQQLAKLLFNLGKGLHEVIHHGIFDTHYNMKEEECIALDHFLFYI